MGQGPELNELQQRVETVGSRFSEIADDSRRRGQRLADLLDEVESGFVRDRLEIDRLKQALAKTQEENAQILTLLQSLLGLAEHAGGLGERAVLYDLEARVDRLYEQTMSMNGEDEPPAADEAEGAETAARGAGSASNGSAGAAALEEDPHEAAEASRWERIPDEEMEEDDPLDVPRMVAEEGGRAAPEPLPDAAGTADGGAVQDIFKRVSMITGRLRET